MRISVEHLHKSYRDANRELVVLEDVTIEFPESSAIGILGRSGVGKSTLLHLLGGLDAPSSGRVRLGELDLSVLSDAERARVRSTDIGFVFQFHHLLPEFSAVENVAMPLSIVGMDDAKAESQAKEMLDRVGLGDRATHRPGELSGGEQQRVAIARALVARPKVLLADEPTGNLDIATGQQVQELLRAIQRETQCSMIVVTHNLELAKTFDLCFDMQPGGNLVPVHWQR